MIFHFAIVGKKEDMKNKIGALLALAVIVLIGVLIVRCGERPERSKEVMEKQKPAADRGFLYIDNLFHICVTIKRIPSFT